MPNCLESTKFCVCHFCRKNDRALTKRSHFQRAVLTVHLSTPLLCRLHRAFVLQVVRQGYHC